MMSMVERVARALRRQWHVANFDRPSEVGWEDEINAARAAIEAMREPTDAMLDMMNVYEPGPVCASQWRDAIETALNEQPS